MYDSDVNAFGTHPFEAFVLNALNFLVCGQFNICRWCQSRTAEATRVLAPLCDFQISFISRAR